MIIVQSSFCIWAFAQAEKTENVSITTNTTFSIGLLLTILSLLLLVTLQFISFKGTLTNVDCNSKEHTRRLGIIETDIKEIRKDVSDIRVNIEKITPKE